MFHFPSWTSSTIFSTRDMIIWCWYNYAGHFPVSFFKWPCLQFASPCRWTNRCWSYGVKVQSLAKTHGPYHLEMPTRSSSPTSKHDDYSAQLLQNVEQMGRLSFKWKTLKIWRELGTQILKNTCCWEYRTRQKDNFRKTVNAYDQPGWCGPALDQRQQDKAVAVGEARG